MIKYTLLTFMIALGLSTISGAETKSSSSASEMHLQVLTSQTFKVNGMVCFLHAQVEKSFNKMDEVHSTRANLDKMEITVVTTTSKGLTKDTIENVIKEAGFEKKKGFVTEKEPTDGKIP